MKHFRHVSTNHCALQWLHKTKDTNKHLYRWFLKLVHDGYDYTINYKPRVQHGNADGISILMCT